MSEALLPVDFDRDTGAFFQAARQGKLIFRKCNACGHGLQMPTQYCGECGGRDTAWRESPGSGTLFTWTTVTHQVHPAYPVPYTIVVVSLDDAPEVRFIGSIPGAPSLTAGEPMRAVFDSSAVAAGLPNWRTQQVHSTSEIKQ